MPSGGSRLRSGPRPDPNSKRSDVRGINEHLRVLPREGYTGKPPDWPMPKGWTRERSLWKKIWTYPQAIAWIDEPWRWLTIADYVRWRVKAEQENASPSTMTQVMRLADAIGITPAGMRENGWTIQAKPVTEEATESPQTQPTSTPKRRLRAVDAG